LRAVFQRRRFALDAYGNTRLANQLINGRHCSKSNKITTIDNPDCCPGTKTSSLFELAGTESGSRQQSSGHGYCTE
jgi:hypothetical protein